MLVIVARQPVRERRTAQEVTGTLSKPQELSPIAADAMGWALEKKAQDPALLDVRGLCSYADFLLILGGRSSRQVRAVAESIRRGMRSDGHRTLGAEGADEGRWVLLDYGEVVVHIFLEELRDFYDLESLWVEAPRVGLDVPAKSAL
jgi:ribosome-associated protein